MLEIKVMIAIWWCLFVGGIALEGVLLHIASNGVAMH
jgi:hypothetical protein